MSGVPMKVATSLLGCNGLAAWFGIVEIANPKYGETVMNSVPFESSPTRERKKSEREREREREKEKEIERKRENENWMCQLQTINSS
jgi:hypothetical protein